MPVVEVTLSVKMTLYFTIIQFVRLLRLPLAGHLERRLPVSGLERGPVCHPERSEGSLHPSSQILRCAQDDRHALQMSNLWPFFTDRPRRREKKGRGLLLII